MKLFRYILNPSSPWTTRLRSDTLYGLILWHVAECEGDSKCQELIASFSENKPAFILSSPVRAGFLPMPALPPIGRSDFRKLVPEIIKDEKDEELALFIALQLFKSFRKMALLPLKAWLDNKAALSAKSLFSCYVRQKEDQKQSGDDFSTSAFEPHVSIDRTTGSAKEGMLFFTAQNYFSPEAKFHLYVKTRDPQWLEKYLKQIGKVGFGHEASTGKGLFNVKIDEDFDAKVMETENANASLLLSFSASQDMSTLEGYYKLEEKLGKTGPGYKNPFKRPFLALQEGSILKKLPAPPYILRKLNTDEKVVQILQPLLFSCCLDLPDIKDAK